MVQLYKVRLNGFLFTRDPLRNRFFYAFCNTNITPNNNVSFPSAQ